MADVSSEHIAVSSSISTFSTALPQSRPDLSTRQSSTSRVTSQLTPDYTVSISPAARDAALNTRVVRDVSRGGVEAVYDQRIDSSVEMKKVKRTKTAIPDGGSNAQIADETDKIMHEARKRIERRKVEGRNEEERVRLKEESANEAERRKNEQKKAEKAETEKQNTRGNALDALLEATRSNYENRLLINAAINGYQSKQSGKSVNVIGGTSADSTVLFIQRNSNQGLSSINLFA